jgi:protein-tyrosine phosphatase
MIQSIYNVFYMSRMLKDKTISSIVDYYYNEYAQVERVYPHSSGLFLNLYNLTYQPTHIIDNIYLGNAYNASNYSDIIDNNFGLIINVTEEIPNYYSSENNIEYYNISIKDLNNYHITDFLSVAIKKIRQFNNENNKQNILIHCFMGSSRSATLLIAYLAKYHNYSIDEALKYCKEKRNLVNINTTFYNDLKQWNETNNKELSN